MLSNYRYRERFTASLPPTRRASADFSRPVFTATGFYLCAKKHKLKVDKSKLIELSGSSEDEFSSVSTSMKDICFDVFGVEKEKKDPKSVKGNRDLLDAIPEKRQDEDGGYSSDEGNDLSAYKKHIGSALPRHCLQPVELVLTFRGLCLLPQDFICVQKSISSRLTRVS
uniref:Origin of replication complex subunit 6 n=1 Tax=Tanacetum cinerariifolium TaxID=118510 RepID=A0A6L2LJ66_TANCI|nr:origin of replication complex subunit 6 [Tanacetum cinerariifolium]